MTRRDHRGRFTAGRVPSPRCYGLPLFKSAAHLAGWRTRRAKRAAWVAAHIETLRRSM